MKTDICFALLFVASNCLICTCRKFEVDVERGTFLRDGLPFRYVSGAMHYFRIPRQHWRDRLLKLKMAGLNAVQTYIEWRSHEPYQMQYDFEGNNDIVHYIKLAQQLDLLVILRPGPYIDSERDLGGYPFWLYQENPEMKLRTKDPSHLTYVDRWYSVLLPKLKPLLYSNGGPIILIQVENEYGAFYCDNEYIKHLRDLLRLYLGPDVQLFSVDGAAESDLQCGSIDGIFATVDFHPGSNITEKFEMQKRRNGGGPCVNTEYYSGWVDYWGKPHHFGKVSFLRTLEEMLIVNASVNIYVFSGGTSFGFNSGAYKFGDQFYPVVTSYDYDAPLSEAGDPTAKYHSVRKLLGKYLPVPHGPVPPPTPKYAYEPLNMAYIGSFLELLSLLTHGQPIWSKLPVTFEKLGVAGGFVMYETTIPREFQNKSKVTLQINVLHDRAYVYVDERFVTKLSDRSRSYSVSIPLRQGRKLGILVESLGRDCYETLKDFKGILSRVEMDNVTLESWVMYPIPLNNTLTLKELPPTRNTSACGPSVFRGTFRLPNLKGLPADTYVIPDMWTKGVLFVNGFNLGRYWPLMGPQVSLYLPASLLRPYPQDNTVMLFELEPKTCPSRTHSGILKFGKDPIINGKTPSALRVNGDKDNFIF